MYPRESHAPSGKKASHKNEAGAKQPSAGATKQAHKKVRFEKSWELCKKHGGMHTTHFTKDCCKYKKDGMVKVNLCTAKKAGKKPNPAKQSFPQLSKKLDQLEKTLNSLTAKSIPAGTKLVLFGRHILNIYVGIVQYILRKTKTWRTKIYLPDTTHKSANIVRY
jgi:hypothetical protein